MRHLPIFGVPRCGRPPAGKRPFRRGTRPARRGIVLIVVLGILALFSLVGVMFVTTAQQAQQAAHAIADADLRNDPPQALLERAMLQVLVGSTHRGSAIGPHGILEDMYGPPTMKGRVQAAWILPDDSSGGQFVSWNIPTGTALGYVRDLYAGRIITMLTGRLAGQSTRIVGWAPLDPNSTSSQWRLRMIPFSGMVNTTSGTLDVTNLGPQAGDEFLINGHPFGGIGIDPQRNNAGQVQQSLNPRLRAVRDFWTFQQGVQDNLGNPPKANEDYDAADNSNVFLAQMLADTGRNRVMVPNPSFHRADFLLSQSSPSSYDNDSVNNAVRTMLANANPGSPARSLMLRPLPADHSPEFAASNPQFWNADPNAMAFPMGDNRPDAGGVIRPIYYWDVDNDNDGEMDSVWIDLGMPVMTDQQGRKFKPLFAIHVQSQDGKLNLNVHGQWNDESPDSPGVSTGSTTAEPLSINMYSGTTPQGSGHRTWTTLDRGGAAPLTLTNTQNWRWEDTATKPMTFPHGGGVSPAEIDLTTVLSQTEFFFLLHGRMVEARPDGTNANQPTAAAVSLVEDGRYGETALGVPPGPFTPSSTTYPEASINSIRPSALPRAGHSLNNSPNTFADDNSPAKHSQGTVDARNRLLGSQGGAGGFGTPVDLQGSGGIMIGAGGQPVFLRVRTDQTARIPNSTTADAIDFSNEATELNPYQQRGTADAIFGPSDLEFLLRPFDPDMQGKNPPGNTSVYNDRQLKEVFPATNRTYRRYHLRDGSRLRHLLSTNVIGHISGHNLFTTDSWDVTTPTRPLVAALYQKLQNMGVADPAGAINKLGNPVYPAAPNNGTPRVIGPGIPFENALGVKMNLNRPFGNGVADVSAANSKVQRIVDYPGLNVTENVFGSSVVADRNNDGETDNFKDALAPQMYARQLFILAMLAGEGLSANPTAPEQQREVLRVAQWAVNVVDFRDQDNIMTPFEVDLRPFTDENGDGNPWDVDGLLSTDESGSGVSRAVVWGMEMSPLLISETLAMHDLRTKDTDQDSTNRFAGGMNPEPAPADWDQEFIPEGNLFVELYSPRNPRTAGTFPQAFQVGSGSGTGNPTWGTIAGDLYVEGNIAPHNTAYGTEPDGGQLSPGYAGLLDLGRSVQNNNRIDPVWRLAVVTPAGTAIDLMAELAKDPEYVRVGGAANRDIERLVYFCPIPSGDEASLPYRDRTYLNRTGSQSVTTESVTINDPNAGAVTSTIRISNVLLGAGRFAMVAPYRRTEEMKNSGGGTSDANTKKQIFLGTAATVPEIQLDFKENGTYQYEGGFAVTDSGTSPVRGAYDTLFNNKFSPLTIGCAGRCYGGWADNMLLGLSVTEPRMDVYSSRYDQPDCVTPAIRNGLNLYDKYERPKDLPGDNNSPYFTLNAMGSVGTPTPKVVLLQRLANPLLPYHATYNPYITIDHHQANPTIVNSSGTTAWATQLNSLRSWQRTGAAVQTNSSLTMISPWTSTMLQTPAATGAAHSFGYINQAYEATFNPTTAVGSNARIFHGMPKTWDFPWITWNNRPFVNTAELMLVPASNPATFSTEVGRSSFNASIGVNLYDQNFPFKFLMPFFAENWPATPAAVGDPPKPPLFLYRMFEYVGVPTAFSGGESLLGWTKNAAGTATSVYPFRPPHNRLPAYREPGRVNLNVPADVNDTTWNAVIGRLNHAPVLNTGGTAAPPQLTSNRSQVIQSLRDDNTTTTPQALTNLFVVKQTDTAWLKWPFRSPFFNTALTPAEQLTRSFFRKRKGATVPLFEFNGSSTNLTGINAQGHAYYRFYTMQRLAQTTTVRSNVYAVWITMGKFEVEPVPNSRKNQFNSNMAEFWDIYPDGYWLKGELGWDTGDVKRHKAFFIVDRTLPVAFERGRAHNSMNCVTLQRFIE